MKQGVRFMAVSVVITVVAGLVMWAVWTQDAERQSIVISGVTALCIQLVAFTIARRMAARNVIAGWGAGAALRMVALAVYAFAGVKVFGLPSSAATLSLAVFLFASTLVEPLFLNP
jgi:hypothetical protein